MLAMLSVESFNTGSGRVYAKKITKDWLLTSNADTGYTALLRVYEGKNKKHVFVPAIEYVPAEDLEDTSMVYEEYKTEVPVITAKKARIVLYAMVGKTVVIK